MEKKKEKKKQTGKMKTSLSEAMEAEERLFSWKDKVENQLRKYLGQKDTSIYRTMRYAVFSGGKRYRSLLVLSTGHFFGAKESGILPFACAVELIHNYSLIHDDLPSMDNDDLRRGKPTCHKAYGEALALLAGDALLTLAFQVMVEAPVESSALRRKEEAIKRISRLAGGEGLIGGQVMDIGFQSENSNEENLLEMIQKKTGSLIVASLQAGALMGGASEHQLRVLTDFGEKLGFAFQLRDDIVDFFQDESSPLSSVPNYAVTYGIEKARKKLELLVDQGKALLEQEKIKSPELFCLTEMLLDIKDEKK